MDFFLRELRHALRGLARSPGFAATAVLALALGIGATTAIFTVLNAVVLDPLPYPASGELVSIGNRVPRRDAEARWGVSPSAYFHYRDQSRALQGIGVYRTWSATVTGGGDAERVQLASVSAGLLPVLRARPQVGRLLSTEDDQPGAVPAALLSHDFWARRYGADPGVVGRAVRVDGQEVRVVGVLERAAQLPEPGVRADVWMAERLDPAGEPQNWHAFTAVGRLRDGATLEGARTELARLTGRFGELFPSAYKPAFLEETGFQVDVVPLRDYVVGDVGRMLWVLLGAVAMVLLVACADVANLFLVRTEGRRREMSIRAALGASRGRLARQLLTEGFLLGVLGGALGVLLALAGVRALVAAAPEHLPRLDEVRLGGAALAFGLALSVAVGLAVGAFPLLRFGSGVSADALREAGRGNTAGRGRGLVRSALVVGQVAMALVLLASAGLMFRTYERLRSVDAGFKAQGVLTMELTLPSARYETHRDVTAFWAQLTARVGALPGVQSAGLSSALPLANKAECRGFFVEDRPVDASGEPLCVLGQPTTPGYMAALGIPLRGGEPAWSDVDHGTAGVVVTRALAERLWPGQDPIGKGIRGMTWEQPFYRVVGVTGHLRAEGLDQPPAEAVFYPTLPMEGAPLWSPARSMTLAVRSASGRPEALASSVRQVLGELDPEVPVANVATMETVVARSVARTSFTLLLLEIAAAVALLLGAVGLYGVLSYVVGQRRGEIAIRMALGARMEQVATLVVWHSMALALAGVALGLLGAFALTRLMQSLLFEVSPTDPVVMGGAAVLLVLVALAASTVPVRRATRVEPMSALRGD